MAHKTIIIALVGLIGILATPRLAIAKMCEVGKASDFVRALESVQSGSKCKTDDKDVREKFDKYRNNSLEFFVIRFNKSVDLTAAMPCFTGKDGLPLVVDVADGVIVNVSAEASLCVGGAAPAIIYGLNISGKVEISGDNNALIASKVNGGIKIAGSDNRLESVEVENSTANGIEISGNENKLSAVKVSKSNGAGINISGSDNKIEDSSVFDNASGVISKSGALISRTVFYDNAGLPISIESNSLPAPVGVTGIPNFADWKVTGNVTPSNSLNIAAARVEIFLKDGPYLAATEDIDPTSGQFVVGIKKPITVGGRTYEDPVFVATVVDVEQKVTSPFSSVPEVADLSDFDSDGIPNDQEDYNHNGIVDFGETDPRKADTDGDGLSDGEERLHTGRVGELIASSRVFADLSKLDPTNPDSDGDCLNDGLELGVAKKATSAVEAQSSIVGAEVAVENPLPVSSHCREILKKSGATTTTPFDDDPSTLTDPTNQDSDLDGLPDGEEDTNFNGARDKNDATVVAAGGVEYRETDPNLPDSDGDSLLDGAEGDKNHDGSINTNESDPLTADTDGDGVTDDYELLRLLSNPNLCDSDGDGLSDGIEAGAISPNSEKPECSGLQTSGTNFEAIGKLSPVITDSDGDGIKDGDEDANKNGWLDFNETDPTVTDTDHDGISDYIEMTLDTDNNGLSNVNLDLIDNGKKCAPPSSVNDLDCDGVVNARDDDSDGDGCLDKDESLETDRDMNGIPDVWESKQANCSSATQSGSSSSGSSSSGASSSSSSDEDEDEVVISKSASEALESDPFGGGACSLVEASSSRQHKNASRMMIPAFLFINATILVFLRRIKKS